MIPLRRHVLIATLAAFVPVHGRAAPADSEPTVSGSATGYYYAMRDQPDFGVGVASINRGPLHLEARYNYEARDAGSAFLGWRFSGGDTVTFEFTPIAGVLFGAARGAIPGFEASIAYGSVDATSKRNMFTTARITATAITTPGARSAGGRPNGCGLDWQASGRTSCKAVAICRADYLHR